MLYSVALAILSIWLRSSSSSTEMASRSERVSVPFVARTASSCIRTSIALTWASAPSAILCNARPSCTFCTATARPADWAAIFETMARPEASSAAELMRSPDERRSSVRSRRLFVSKMWRWALSDATFVLICMTTCSPPRPPGRAGAGDPAGRARRPVDVPTSQGLAGTSTWSISASPKSPAPSHSTRIAPSIG